MEYYGFTEADYSKVISLFNKISVTGMDQIDAYHEATSILRKPALIKCNQEGVKEDVGKHSTSNN